MAWGSCTRYYKLRKRGRGMEYPGAKGKTWLIDEALGRAVLRFPVFSENLKKKKKRRFLISVWLIHSGFSFPDFLVWKERRGKKIPLRFCLGILPGFCHHQENGSFSRHIWAASHPFLMGAVKSCPWLPISRGKKEQDLLVFHWKVGGLGGEQIISQTTPSLPISL